MTNSQSFADKVYQKLDEMKPGNKLRIDYQHKNASQFVEIVKEYIQVHKLGGGIEFSNDYKYVRKYEIF